MSPRVPEDWRHLALDPPRAHGDPVARGKLRASPEDFEVHEELSFQPDGEGPHWLLRVVKRGANTEWVAGQLARFAGMRASDVGFAGLKDRHAVTGQWFSVPVSKISSADWLALQHPEFRVHEVHAHSRKLRRGALAGNRFRICVRQLDADPAAVEGRLAKIALRGVPNYFGSQRFGREAGNLSRVLDWSASGHLPRSRSERSFTISAARSLVFNVVLAERVTDRSWDRLRPGDVANLDGTGSIFTVDAPTSELEERSRALDIHPTGPLWGAGMLRSGAEVREIETGVERRFEAVTMALARAGLAHERRALRLRVADLQAHAEDAALALEFRLTAGAFATTVLRELLDVTGES
jgi:tRNA pseudouridine13 synthase